MVNILAVGANNVRNTFDFAPKNWTVSQFYWHSLYAICDEKSPEGQLFNKVLEETQCEYLVFDVSSLSLDVLVQDDVIYSQDNPNGKSGKRENFYSDENFVRKTINRFISKVKKNFDSKHIILISTKRAQRYKKGTLVRPVSDAVNNSRQMNYEKYLIEQSNCRYIDVFDSYFMDEYYRFGRSLLNYEEYAYDDIRLELISIFEDKPSPNKFAIKLNRYLEYGDYLEQSFRLPWLFDQNKILDCFISLLSVEFVKKHFEKLVVLGQRSIENYSALLNAAKAVNDDEIVCAAKWYIAVKTNNYRDVDAFDKIAPYNLGLKSTLVSAVNSEFQSRKIPRIATIHNINDAISILTDKSFNYKKVEEPILIDIWGSCISREEFNSLLLKENVCLNLYMFRTSPLHIEDGVINVDETYLSDLKNYNGSAWRRGFVSTNLYRKTKNCIKNTQAEWVMIDLYDVCELTYQIGNEKFVLDYDTTKMPIFDILRNEYGCKQLGFIEYEDDELYSRLDSFIDLLKSTYGKNIILTKIFFNNSFITDSGSIESLKRAPNEIVAKNNYIRKCEEYICKKLNCWVLDFSSQFLADERFVWGESPVHYENSFYEYAATSIKSILNGDAKNKNINFVPSKYKLPVLLRLKQSNRFTTKEAYWFCRNAIDKYLFLLDNKIILENYDYIAQLLDSLPPDVERLDFIAAIDDEHSELKNHCIERLL